MLNSTAKLFSVILASFLVVQAQNFSILPDGFQYCGNTSTDILHLSNVTITPNPPVAGKLLTILALGNITGEGIVNG